MLYKIGSNMQFRKGIIAAATATAVLAGGLSAPAFAEEPVKADATTMGSAEAGAPTAHKPGTPEGD
ncbi:MAG: hypothetical protein SPK16_05490, partial [Corynebacterium sp.]|nr:hypothetical protein [Corynebacterium sp.]